MSGFDRIKPPERRLLEREDGRQPDSRDADAEGRAGLFSASRPPTTPGAGAPRRTTAGRGADAPSPGAPGPDEAEAEVPPRSIGPRHADGSPTSPDDPRLPQGPSPLTVECGHCGVECPMPVGDAVRKALPLSLVAPWKRHPVFAICPCGERRTWLRPSVGLPG